MRLGRFSSDLFLDLEREVLMGVAGCVESCSTAGLSRGPWCCGVYDLGKVRFDCGAPDMACSIQEIGACQSSKAVEGLAIQSRHNTPMPRLACPQKLSSPGRRTRICPQWSDMNGETTVLSTSKRERNQEDRSKVNKFEFCRGTSEDEEDDCEQTRKESGTRDGICSVRV